MCAHAILCVVCFVDLIVNSVSIAVFLQHKNSVRDWWSWLKSSCRKMTLSMKPGSEKVKSVRSILIVCEIKWYKFMLQYPGGTSCEQALELPLVLVSHFPPLPPTHLLWFAIYIFISVMTCIILLNGRR